MDDRLGVSLGAIVKGYSDREDISSTVAGIWQLLRRWQIEVYFDRIPTDGNLSDGPSRGSWREAGNHGWAVMPAVIPDCVSMIF